MYYVRQAVDSQSQPRLRTSTFTAYGRRVSSLVPLYAIVLYRDMPPGYVFRTSITLNIIVLTVVYFLMVCAISCGLCIARFSVGAM